MSNAKKKLADAVGAEVGSIEDLSPEERAEMKKTQAEVDKHFDYAVDPSAVSRANFYWTFWEDDEKTDGMTIPLPIPNGEVYPKFMDYFWGAYQRLITPDVYRKALDIETSNEDLHIAGLVLFHRALWLLLYQYDESKKEIIEEILDPENSYELPADVAYRDCLATFERADLLNVFAFPAMCKLAEYIRGFLPDVKIKKKGGPGGPKQS